MNERHDFENDLGKELALAELEKLKAEARREKRHQESLEKIVSLILVAFYLMYAWIFMCENSLDLIQLLGALALPMACIWFSEAVGGYVGPTFGYGIIWRKSHPKVIRLIGWIFLLLPLIIALAAKLFGTNTCNKP